MKELSKAESLRVKEIDSKVKNKFRYDWLDQKFVLKTKKGETSAFFVLEIS